MVNNAHDTKEAQSNAAKPQEAQYPWCVVHITPTNAGRYAEIFEIGAMGCDGITFHSKIRPEARLSKHTFYSEEELQEGKLDVKGFKEFLARYDAIVTWDAFFLAPRIKDWLPSPKDKKAAGSKNKHISFCCAKSQLKMYDTVEGVIPSIVAECDKDAVDRCKNLMRLLKLDKLNTLVNTLDNDYFVVSPVFIKPQDRWLLQEHNFKWHTTKPIKYCQANEVANGFPFEVTTRVIARKDMFVTTKEG